MPSEKHWYDEKTEDDAPENWTYTQSLAWADGYNTAVKTCIAEQSAVIKQELPKQHWSDVMLNEGEMGHE